MFLALRELKFARGRSGLMGAGMVNAQTDDGTQVDLSLFAVEPG
jgi:hypothetical protein